MSKSSLVQVNIPAYSGNYTVGRSGRKIEAITIHHMAGVLSAESCGYIWQRVDRYGSSHYGIGNDGKIAQYVDEENTAWTNSNWDSNCKSVTIETSNCENGGNWRVSDQALNSLIKLVADIAKRNNLGTLVKGINVTWHSMFTSTNCPGPYLMSKFDYIIAEANKINSGTPTPITPSIFLKYSKGDNIVLNGYLYRDSYGNGQGYKMTNHKGTITLVNSKGSKPYHIDNLGWVAESDITKQINTPIKVGDIVKIKKGAKSYEGVNMASFVYNNTYRVDQLKGNRAVLDLTGICTAFNVNDLIKV